jgi:hypothetical protein
LLAAREIGPAEIEQAGSDAGIGECRRFGPRRVDCRIVLRGTGCYEVLSLKLSPTGSCTAPPTTPCSTACAGSAAIRPAATTQVGCSAGDDLDVAQACAERQP